MAFTVPLLTRYLGIQVGILGTLPGNLFLLKVFTLVHPEEVVCIYNPP